MNTYEFLQDKHFLQLLDKLRIKEQFVKITVLNWKEEPLKLIQGIAINGSVNLDSSSSMRRTATLSLFAEEKENNLANIDHLFSVNKKCKLELGIVNNVPEYNRVTKDEYNNITNNIINYQEIYGDIIWFPLGLFVMFNPSISHSMEGVTISMQLKDKMCLLNGDLGGEIHSAVDFSYKDEIYDEQTSTTVEKTQVRIYDIIVLLVNHWGNEPLDKIVISEVPLKIKQVVKYIGDGKIYLSKKKGYYTLSFSKPESFDIENGDKLFESGYDIGFIYSDFVYPGELACNAGLVVTSVLDKLIGIMGNYEYFYDVFGNFVFQLKDNYLNMTNVANWIKDSSQKTKELPVDDYRIETRLTKPVYNFFNNKYTTAYNNSLNYNNIKNDFVVWGYRKSIDSNIVHPCRFHLAIDKKPDLVKIKSLGKKHKIALFTDDFQVTRGIAYDTNNTPKKGDKIIWNEVLYTITEVVTRFAVDWRELIYYQMLEDEKHGTGLNTERNNSYFQYYAELKELFPKIFDLSTQKYKINILEKPSLIDYFLDFIDESSELGQYGVNNIGRRPKIIDGNNEGINCVFEPTIPDVVYVDGTDPDYLLVRDMVSGYGQEWTQIEPLIFNLFEIGGHLNSCYEKIKDLLYQYTHVNNTISITSLPIYYLLPNTRISVEDDIAGIYGDYIIQSISLPLDISSAMTINAYKALQKI